MKRRGYIRRRREKARRSERVEDPEYMEIVRTLKCCAPLAGVIHFCFGPIEADHAGPRPCGRKCSDDQTIPLCSLHHRNRTDATGPFKGWDRWKMRSWCTERIAETRTQVHARRARIDIPF